jgi:hypothetical protein
MSHPKNRLKLTGDTHLPDIGLDTNLDDDKPIEAVLDEEEEEEVRIYADGHLSGAAAVAMPAAAEAPVQPKAQPHGIVGKLERKVARQAARTPLLAISAGLFVGWMLARTLRR